MEGGVVGHNFQRDPPRDHPCQVRFNLVQRFQRRRFKCEILRRTTDGRTDRRRMPSDGKSSYGLWPGELKTIEIPRCKMHIHFIIAYVVQQNVVVNKWLRPKYWPFCRSTGNTSIFSTRFSSSYSADAATGSTSSFRRSYSSVENVGNTWGNINIEDIMYVYFL